MKILILSLCGLLTLGQGLAFASAADTFGPPPKREKKSMADLKEAPAVDLDHGKFTPAALTNQVDPAWLKPTKDFYRLGPGDVVEIEMLGEAGSATTANIGPDGKVYFSLLPGTFVWGLTLTEARQALEDGMKKFLRQPPDIAITLRSATSKTVWLLGNVQTPGIYPLNTPLTILEAITLAGGTLNIPGSRDGICDLKRSFVMRDGLLLPIDFEKLLRDGDLSQNIYLQPNDLVYLRSGSRQNIYVLGSVANPTIVSFTDQITLMGVIGTAGGPIPYAHLSQVAVIRGSLVNPEIAIVDFKKIMKGEEPDVRLQAGDIVHVPHVPWRGLARFAEDALRQFVYGMASNEGYRATGYRGDVIVTPYSAPPATIIVTPTP